MEITTLLENEHAEVSTLFAKITQASSAGEKQFAFDKLAKKLELHASAEEAVFYPEVQKEAELRDLIRHAEEEHDTIRDGIKKCQETDCESSEWLHHLAKLEVDVKHHVNEEETILFPQVRRIWSLKKRSDLGVKFAEFSPDYFKAA